MRNIILILIGLLSTINLYAQSGKKVVQLSGTIADKYPIVMTLSIENQEVLGFYYYKKYKTKILLKGKIKDDEFILEEAPDLGYETEFEKGFIGKMSDSHFVGNWVNEPKNKKLKCNLTINSTNQVKLKDIPQVEGTYESIYNSDEYNGRVILKNISGEMFFFDISNGTEMGCAGYMVGLLELKNFKHGVFSKEFCKKIEFNISNNKLIIKEENCEYHGVRCPFEGEYNKAE